MGSTPFGFDYTPISPLERAKELILSKRLWCFFRGSFCLVEQLNDKRVLTTLLTSENDIKEINSFIRRNKP